MERLLLDIETLKLTPNQCDDFLIKVKTMLENKKTENYVQWLIHKYHINKDFYCLTHATKTFVRNNGNTTFLTIEFPNRHDPDGWETCICIWIENDIIVNVVYTTDRYLRYEYNNPDFPYGEFQGKCIKTVYSYDQTRLASILNDIDEVKELCQFLI